MNFNKEGYSADETAQILHCCKTTILTLIDTGELGANIYPKEKIPGKRRRVRITRKHIQDYMRSHQSKFSKEDLDAWKVFEEKKPVPKPEIHEAYEAHSLSELTGAWAGLVEQNKQEISRIEEGLENLVATPKPPVVSFSESIKAERPSFSVEIDGRIAIGNIESGTASKIIDALLQDGNISYNDITIKKGVCYK